MQHLTNICNIDNQKQSKHGMELIEDKKIENNQCPNIWYSSKTSQIDIAELSRSEARFEHDASLTWLEIQVAVFY